MAAHTGYIRADVLLARDQGLLICPDCGAKYTDKLDHCPKCNRPNNMAFNLGRRKKPSARS